MENEEIFIEYFLEKNEFAQAFKLIEKLKNTEKACAYLIKHFTASQHQAMVTPGTPLARELAKHYARDKKILPVYAWLPSLILTWKRMIPSVFSVY